MGTLTVAEEEAVIEAMIEGGLLEYRSAFFGYGKALYITEKGREAIADIPHDQEDNWLLQRIVNL